MVSINKEDKIAFILCIEVVLMRSGNTKYNSVLSKLHAQYNCGTDQIVDHPEYLKSVLKEVYKHDYNAIIDEISLETDTLNDVDEFKAEFFKFMKS